MSVLEQHHAATAFKIIREEKFNVFDQLSYKQLKALRKTTIKNVLATDMKFHRDKVDQFSS